MPKPVIQFCLLKKKLLVGFDEIIRAGLRGRNNLQDFGDDPDRRLDPGINYYFLIDDEFSLS